MENPLVWQLVAAIAGLVVMYAGGVLVNISGKRHAAVLGTILLVAGAALAVAGALDV